MEDFGKASQSHFAFRVCAIAETLSSEKKAERASDHRTDGRKDDAVGRKKATKKV